MEQQIVYQSRRCHLPRILHRGEIKDTRMRAGQEASPEDVAELRDLTAKVRTGAASKDLAVFFEKHLAYRRRVWELSGNRFLKETLERLVAPLYALYLMRSNFNREGLFQTIEDCLAHQDKTSL